MAFDVLQYKTLKSSVGDSTTLVAVSKTKPVEDIEEAYAYGVRDFGENYVQELREKQPSLPKDIRWHFIGHLQSNKVKYIAPYVFMIQSVDSAILLKEINKQGLKNQRKIKVLLQVHVAQEETKFGWNPEELKNYLSSGEWKTFTHVSIEGVMGMASFVSNQHQIRREFEEIYHCFNRLNSLFFEGQPMTVVSMGMSGDWSLAMECGSNLIRVGSALFGSRN